MGGPALPTSAQLPRPPHPKARWLLAISLYLPLTASPTTPTTRHLEHRPSAAPLCSALCPLLPSARCSSCLGALCTTCLTLGYLSLLLQLFSPLSWSPSCPTPHFPVLKAVRGLLLSGAQQQTRHQALRPGGLLASVRVL